MKEFSRDEILQKVAALPSHPIAVEAYWDGDSVGWFIILAAVYADAGSKTGYRDIWLAKLCGSGGDFRIFRGLVPPWPEAEFAALVGQEVASGFGIPFYFASPTHPEDECPRWWERDKSTPCGRCGIPLLQNDRCAWRGQCYNCHSAESRRIKG